MASSSEVIADNSTLSNFARSGHLNLLRQLFPNGIWTTSEVIAEIKRGVAKYPSLKSLLSAWKTWLKVISRLKRDELQIQQHLKRQYTSIREGADSSVLAVAKARSWIVMTDDEGMIKVARQEGIQVLGTADLLREAMWRGLLTLAQLQQVKMDIEAKAKFRVKDPDP